MERTDGNALGGASTPGPQATVDEPSQTITNSETVLAEEALVDDGSGARSGSEDAPDPKNGQPDRRR